MSFLRPEAVAALRRYAEPAVYAGIAGFCLWTGAGMLGRANWFGLVPLAIGVLAAIAVLGSVERLIVARRSARAGPGLVSVREGQIGYFGPHGGAGMAVDALVRVEIVTDPGNRFADGAARWELTDEEGQRLSIPASAANADALLDVLGTLPGFNNMAVVMALRSDRPGRHGIWHRLPGSGLDQISRT